MGFQLFCCWPGLAALWYRGNSRSLLAALFFCWVVCMALLATFVWPQWLNQWVVRSVWGILAVVWFASFIKSHLGFARLIGKPDNQSQSDFEQAQQQYLQGNWFETEAILLNLLDKFPRDAEALLLLVGVLRHTQRWQPALRRLDQLESLDTAANWRFEITRERHIVEKRFTESLSEPLPAQL